MLIAMILQFHVTFFPTFAGMNFYFYIHEYSCCFFDSVHLFFEINLNEKNCWRINDKQKGKGIAISC